MNYFLITVNDKPAYVALSEAEAETYRESLRVGFNAQHGKVSRWRNAKNVQVVEVPGDSWTSFRADEFKQLEVIEYVEQGTDKQGTK